MKLSEAIRLGSMVTKKVNGDYIIRDTHDVPVGACALGAAIVATGDVVGAVYEALEKRFPIVNRLTVNPITRSPWPATGKRFHVGFIIANLNDNVGWTREEIADWVETLEAQEPAPAVVEQTVAKPELVTA